MGGMAEVYKAEYRNDSSVVVAIKRILPQFSQDKKLISMLVNEARLSMMLKHPNIVPVLDFGLVDGDYFIAMEYIRGKDLKSIMIRCKSKEIELPIHMAVFMMIKILHGLHYAHEKRDSFDQALGIVHRDVSPHNILISLWGQVKILDFGIAKASSITSSTQTGILKGKFSYMSPEQAEGKEVDPRTDIFSAGILLWELLTLESYYVGETDIKLLQNVRNAKFRDPSDLNSKVPRRLSQIVARALQKKPKKRFESAAEFAFALEDYQQDTFGTVSEADLAAYVRSLFSINEKDLEGERPPGENQSRDVISGGIDRALAETMAAGQPSTGSRSVSRMSRAQKNQIRELVPWISTVIVVAIAVGIFAKYSPKHLFKMFDQKALDLASYIHHRLPENERQEAKEIKLPATSETTSSYKLYYAPEAERYLDDLPFEDFESARDRAIDLANDPKPSGVKPSPTRPGTYYVLQNNFRISFKINEELRTVTVTSIQKI